MLADILNTLKDVAAAPLARATTMPKDIYTNPLVLEHEISHIFSKDWVCVGRADTLPHIGDYMTVEIANQPLIVTRGKDNQLSAMSNICLHRGMVLVEGRGNAKKFTCPYHAWTYHPDGKLAAAAYMDKSECFDKAALRLPQAQCQVYLGWIYVNLDPDALPVKQCLSELTTLLEPYHMENYVSIFEEEHYWNTNWKCLTENFMEGYHLPVAHSGTVGSHFNLMDTEFDERGQFDHFTYQYFTKKDSAPVGTAHPSNTTLTGKWRSTSIMPTVFPSHMYVLAPDHLWYLALLPDGTDHVQIKYGAAMAPEVLDASEDRDQLIADTKAFLDDVQEEDRTVVEGIFKGAKAPLTKAGPLSWLERENHEFTNYLARKLIPN